MVTTICAMAVIAGLIGVFVYRIWEVIKYFEDVDAGESNAYMGSCRVDIPMGCIGKGVVHESEEVGEKEGREIHGEEGTVEGEVLSLEGNGGAISLDDVWVEVKDEGKAEAAGKEKVAVEAEQGLKAALKGKDRESEGRVVAGETVTCGKGWNGWC